MTDILEDVTGIEEMPKGNLTKDSPWLVFMQKNCGYCKQVEPIVTELVKEGYSIIPLKEEDNDSMQLKLSLAEKYNSNCGSPWFVNSKTGINICGAVNKSTIIKWLKGEEIVQDQRTGMFRPIGKRPNPPLLYASEEEIDQFKKDYKKWAKNNTHLDPRHRPLLEDMLKAPRPKTTPPDSPAKDFTNEQWENWIKAYDKWTKENAHLDEAEGHALLTGGAIRERLLELKADRDPEIQFSFKLQQLHERIEALEKKLGMEMPYEAQFSV